MANLQLTSNITFLYFNDLEAAKPFFEEVLGLEKAYDPGWAAVYRLRDKAFLGAVDNHSGSIQVTSTDSVLISLTVDNIEEVHESLKGSRGGGRAFRDQAGEGFSSQVIFLHRPGGIPL